MGAPQVTPPHHHQWTLIIISGFIVKTGVIVVTRLIRTGQDMSDWASENASTTIMHEVMKKLDSIFILTEIPNTLLEKKTWKKHSECPSMSTMMIMNLTACLKYQTIIKLKATASYQSRESLVLLSDMSFVHHVSLLAPAFKVVSVLLNSPHWLLLDKKNEKSNI